MTRRRAFLDEPFLDAAVTRENFSQLTSTKTRNSFDDQLRAAQIEDERAERERERIRREKEAAEREAAERARREHNAALRAQEIATGQRFIEDADGLLRPVFEPVTGKPLFSETSFKKERLEGTKWVESRRNQFGETETRATPAPLEFDTTGKIFTRNEKNEPVILGTPDELVDSDDEHVKNFAATKLLEDEKKNAQLRRIEAQRKINALKSDRLNDTTLQALTQEAEALRVETPKPTEKRGWFGTLEKPSAQQMQEYEAAEAARKQRLSEIEQRLQKHQLLTQYEQEKNEADAEYATISAAGLDYVFAKRDAAKKSKLNDPQTDLAKIENDFSRAVGTIKESENNVLQKLKNPAGVTAGEAVAATAHLQKLNEQHQQVIEQAQAAHRQTMFLADEQKKQTEDTKAAASITVDPPPPPKFGEVKVVKNPTLKQIERIDAPIGGGLGENRYRPVAERDLATGAITVLRPEFAEATIEQILSNDELKNEHIYLPTRERLEILRLEREKNDLRKLLLSGDEKFLNKENREKKVKFLDAEIKILEGKSAKEKNPQSVDKLHKQIEEKRLLRDLLKSGIGTGNTREEAMRALESYDKRISELRSNAVPVPKAEYDQWLNEIGGSRKKITENLANRREALIQSGLSEQEILEQLEREWEAMAAERETAQNQAALALQKAIDLFSEGRISSKQLDEVFFAAGAPQTGLETYKAMQGEMRREQKYFDELVNLYRGNAGGFFGAGGWAALSKAPTPQQQEFFAQREKELQEKLGVSPERADIYRDKAAALALRTAMKGLSEAQIVQNPGQFTPFVGFAFELAQIAEPLSLAMRLNNGEELTQAELARLEAFQDEMSRDSSFWAKTADAIAGTISFMGELGATFALAPTVVGAGAGAAGLLAKKAGKEGIKEALKTLASKEMREAVKRGIAQYAARGAQKLPVSEFLGRAALEEMVRLPVASGGKIFVDYQQRIAPQVEVHRDELGQLSAKIADVGEDKLTAFYKAVANQGAENFSERLGFLVDRGLGKLGEAPAFAWLSAFVKKNSPQSVEKLFRSMQLDSLAGEFAEERIADILRHVSGVKEFELPNAHDLSVELATLAAPQAARGIASSVVSGYQERRLKRQRQVAEQEVQSFFKNITPQTLSRRINNQLPRENQIPLEKVEQALQTAGDVSKLPEIQEIERAQKTLRDLAQKKREKGDTQPALELEQKAVQLETEKTKIASGVIAVRANAFIELDQLNAAAAEAEAQAVEASRSGNPEVENYRLRAIHARATAARASALAKVAMGRPLDFLSSEELVAVGVEKLGDGKYRSIFTPADAAKAKTPDAAKISDIQIGANGVPIITDAAIRWTKTNAPQVAQTIRWSETEAPSRIAAASQIPPASRQSSSLAQPTSTNNAAQGTIFTAVGENGTKVTYRAKGTESRVQIERELAALLPQGEMLAKDTIEEIRDAQQQPTTGRDQQPSGQGAAAGAVPPAPSVSSADKRAGRDKAQTEEKSLDVREALAERGRSVAASEQAPIQPRAGDITTVAQEVELLGKQIARMLERLNLPADTVSVEKTDIKVTPHAKLQEDGRIVVYYNEENLLAEMAIRHKEDKGDAPTWLRDAFNEELVHIADYLSTREAWQASDIADARLFYQNTRRATFNEIAQIIRAGGETADLAAEALVKAFAAYRAAGADTASKHIAMLEGVTLRDKAMSLLVDAMSGDPQLMPSWVLAAETLRMVVQSRKKATVTETGYRKIVNALLNYMRDLIDTLRRVAGIPAFAKPVKEIEEILEKAELAVAETFHTGNEAQSFTEGNEPITYNWAVVEADSLIVDDAALQNRKVDTAGRETTIADIAKNTNYFRLSDSPLISDGAPTIGPDGKVEIGNTRVLGLRRAYQSGASNILNYRDALIADAANKGLDPERIRSMNRPILVRVRKTEVNRRAFIESGNVSNIAPLTEVEMAVQDAENMRPEMLENIVPNAEGDILGRDNMPFIRQFVAEVIPPRERISVINAQGELSQTGYRRIRNALFVKAFGNSPATQAALSRMAESVDDASRGLSSILAAISPVVARYRGLAKAGALHDLQVGEDITQAAQKLFEIRQAGQKVQTYLDQAQLLGDGITDFQKTLIKFFDENSRASRKTINTIRAYIQAIERLGDPRTMDMFGDNTVPAKEVLWNLAVKNEPSMAEETALAAAQRTPEEEARALELAEKPFESLTPQQQQLLQDVARQQTERIRRLYEGTPLWLKAPNGQPSKLNEQQWLQVRTPLFKRWFGDWEAAATDANYDTDSVSKVVDKNGEPLVLYHGTLRNFNAFRPLSHFGTAEQANNRLKSFREEDQRILPVFLKIKKPVRVKDDGTTLFNEGTMNYAKSLGGDGVVYENEVEGPGDSYMIFYPNQVKSAIGNNGAFTTGGNILYSSSRIQGIGQKAALDKLKSLGYPENGIVRVVNRPDAQWDGRTLIQNGKAVAIEINGATVRNVEQVLAHELAEAANADGALNNLISNLSQSERDAIQNDIARLGYAEAVRDREAAARAVEQLVKSWRGRNWFERAVAEVLAWASKLGLPMTRLAAEAIAARAVAEVDANVRRWNTAEALSKLTGARRVMLDKRQAVLVPPGQMEAAHSIVAYHGTRHTVDRFKTEKIDTGEGAQAYGWGLYFAETKEVAETYRTAGATGVITNIDTVLMGVLFDGQPVETIGDLVRIARSLKADSSAVVRIYDVATMQRPGEPLLDAAKRYLDKKSKSLAAYQKKAILKLAKQLNGRLIRVPTGNLYTVELDVETDDLLDWDKPLNEQSPKVKASLQSIGITKVPIPFGGVLSFPKWEAEKNARTLTKPAEIEENPQAPGFYFVMSSYAKGSQIYNHIARLNWKPNQNSQKIASETLFKAGIPGIRYLDGNSRDTGEGTRNYVIFDENKIRIIDSTLHSAGRSDVDSSELAEKEIPLSEVEFALKNYGKNSKGEYLVNFLKDDVDVAIHPNDENTDKTLELIENALIEMGVDFDTDKSRVSESRYVVVRLRDNKDYKIRISNHYLPSKYSDADFVVANFLQGSRASDYGGRGAHWTTAVKEIAKLLKTDIPDSTKKELIRLSEISSISLAQKIKQEQNELEQRIIEGRLYKKFLEIGKSIAPDIAEQANKIEQMLNEKRYDRGFEENVYSGKERKKLKFKLDELTNKLVRLGKENSTTELFSYSRVPPATPRQMRDYFNLATRRSPLAKSQQQLKRKLEPRVERALFGGQEAILFSSDRLTPEELRNATKAQLKQWAKAQPEPVLKENPNLYFHTEGAKLVSVASLRATKPPESQPKSVHNAMVFANAAANGWLDKRQPISVLDNGDGSYTVVDGNATYGMAVRSGWEKLPVKILTPLEATTILAKEAGDTYPHKIDGTFRSNWKVTGTGRRVKLADGRIGRVIAFRSGDDFDVLTGTGKLTGLSEKDVLVELTPEELELEPHFIRRLEQCARFKPDFDATLDAIAAVLPKGVALKAALKGAPRALEKAAEKLKIEKSKFNAGKIQLVSPASSFIEDLADILRATILVDDVQNVSLANAAILRAFSFESRSAESTEIGENIHRSGDGKLQLKILDRFLKPTPAGYADVQIKAELEPGLFAEIQVNIPEMLAAKEGNAVKQIPGYPAEYYPEKLGIEGLDPDYPGHKMFEEYRSIPDKNSPRAKELQQKMAALYRAAIAAHERRMLASRNASSLETSRTQGSSPVSGKTPSTTQAPLGPRTKNLPESETTGSPSSSTKNLAEGENSRGNNLASITNYYTTLRQQRNTTLRSQGRTEELTLFDLLPPEDVPKAKKKTVLKKKTEPQTQQEPDLFELTGALPYEPTNRTRNLRILERSDVAADRQPQQDTGTAGEIPAPELRRPELSEGSGAGYPDRGGSGGLRDTATGRSGDQGEATPSPQSGNVGERGEAGAGETGDAIQSGIGISGGDRRDAGEQLGRGTLRPGTQREVGGGGRRRVERPKRERPPEGSPQRNHVIQPGDTLAEGGAITRLRKNLQIIRLLKELEDSGRDATVEEKKLLAQYVGWGGIPQVFDRVEASRMEFIEDTEKDIQRWERAGYGEQAWVLERKAQLEETKKWRDKWGEHHKEIKKLLSEEEFNDAARSTINAHYTSPEVIRAMWDMAKRLGFDGGNVLEPAAGIGHYIGLMPQEFADATTTTAVELDSLSARITAKLYPETTTHKMGFQDAPIPDNSQDVVISNVPFANVAINDPSLDAMGAPRFSLHNYFFAKAIQKAKPGGLIAFITTSHTMDSNANQRLWLTKHADLIAAYRLPNTAFKGNAATEVTTDIILLRKKGENLPPLPEENWAGTEKVDTPDGPIAVNEYFARHPENILGQLSLQGTMYAKGEMAVLPREGENFIELLNKAIQKLPENVLQTDNIVAPLEKAPTFYTGLKVGSFFVDSDGTVKSYGATNNEQFNNSKTKQVILDFIPLRNAINELYKAELDPVATDEQLAALREQLNQRYDAFVAKHGAVHDNAKILSEDSDFYRLLGAEVEDKSGSAKERLKKKKYKKGDVFTQRILSPVAPAETADNIADAYTQSLIWKGNVDTGYIAALLNKTPAEVENELLEAGYVFKDPSTGSLESRERYLSGNVRKKLKIAKAAAKNDPSLVRNVEALQTVQPQDVPSEDIAMDFGAHWMPPEIFTNFLQRLFSTADISVDYIAGVAGQSAGKWVVNFGGKGARATTGYTRVMNDVYSVEGMPALQLVDNLLNSRPVTVFVRDEKGRQTSVVDKKQTDKARDVAKAITDAWNDFVLNHPSVREKAAARYNEIFNSYVTPEYNGQFLQLPWINKKFDLYPKKKNTVWRALQEGRALIAHGVGGGKTIIGTAIALELKRLGRANKPLIAVHNATLEQFASTINRIAPTANVLVARKEDLEGAKRKEFYAKARAGNWDAIVMAHSTLDQIPDSPKVVEKFRREIRAQFQKLIEQTEDKKTVKEYEKALARIEEKLDKNLERKTDDVLDFDELGIDALIVDEAHLYKKVPFVSNLGRVAGVDTGDSKRAGSVFLKSISVRERMGGKNVYTMTGTPVTNTLGEAWNMIRLIAPDVLKDFEIESFDAFVSAFGKIQDNEELRPDGSTKPVRRLAQIKNLPEWTKLFRQVADVVMGSDMDARGRPEIKGGQPELVAVPRTRAVAQFVGKIRKILDSFEKMSGKEKKENSHIPLLTYNAAKAAAVDIRLIDPNAEDDPNSKVNVMLRKAIELYHRSSDYKGTQVIFSDIYRPMKSESLDFSRSAMEQTDFESETEVEDAEESAEEFNLYRDIKQKLIAQGVPANEIAIITDVKNDKQKEALFEKVNNGEVRFIIGSTQRLGTGVNMQQRMLAAHHLDVPWTPAELEQRDGRVYRDGNIHKDMGVPVEIYRYGMVETLDAALWQKIETKSRFIKQVLSGQINERIIEDDAALLSLEEQKAVLQGADGIEKFKADELVKNLSFEKRSWEAKKQRALDTIKKSQSVINYTQSLLDEKQPMLERVQALSAGFENVSVNGQPVKNAEEFKEAIKKLFEKITLYAIRTNGSSPTSVGDIIFNGVPITLTASVTERLGEKDIEKRFIPELTLTVAGETSNKQTVPGNLLNFITSFPQKLANNIANLQRELKESQQILENTRQNMPLEEKWPKERELAEAIKRAEEIKQRINEKIEREKQSPTELAAGARSLIPFVEGGAKTIVIAARKFDGSLAEFKKFLVREYGKNQSYPRVLPTLGVPEVVKELPRNLQAVVTPLFEGMTGADIARTLNLPPEAVVEKLRDAMDELSLHYPGLDFDLALQSAGRTGEANYYKQLLDDIDALLDERELEKYDIRAQIELFGQRTIGVPSKAKYAQDDSIRRDIDAVQFLRENEREAETFAQWTDEARQLIERDGEKTIMTRLLEKSLRPDLHGALTAAETVAAKLVIPQVISDAAKSGNKQAFLDSLKLAYAYDMAGADVARALSARRDPFKTPAQRHTEFLAKMVATPDAKTRQEIDKLPPDARESALSDAQKQRLEKIEKALADMGVTLEDIFAGEAYVGLKAKRFVADAVEKMGGDKAKTIAKYILDGFSDKLIAKETGLDIKSVAEARKKFDEILEQNLLKYVDRGFTVEDLDTMDLSELFAAPAVRTVQLSEEERKRRVREMLRKIRPDAELANSGKLVKRLKKRPSTPKEKEDVSKTSSPSEYEFVKFDPSNASQVVRAARIIQAADSNALDMVYEFWINSILSGPQTQFVNILGNGFNALWEFTVQRTVEAGINTVVRDNDSATFRELVHLWRGAIPGIAKGFAAAVKAFSTEHDFFLSDKLNAQMEFEDYDKLGEYKAAIPGKTGRVIRLPGRVLMFFDAFFKTLTSQMEVAAYAYRFGKAQNLKGKQLEKFITAEINTPGSASWQRAVASAMELTFQTELPQDGLGGVVNKISRARKMQSTTVGGQLGELFLAMNLPFIKTPYNIFRIGLRKSPLGLVNVGAHIASGLYSLRKGRPFVEGYSKAMMVRDLAEQLIAWSTLAVVMGMVEGDADDEEKFILISGSRPFGLSTKGERELLERKIGGSYQIRIGGRNGIYLNYGRIEPFAVMLGTIVDAVRTVKTKRATELLPALVGNLVAQSTEKTFLSGITNLAETLDRAQTEPGEVGKFWVKRFLTGFVPNIIKQPLRNWDQYKRDTRFENLEYMLLPYSELATKAHNIYGQEIEKLGSPVSRLFFNAGQGVSSKLNLVDMAIEAWNRRHPDERWYPQTPNKSYYQIRLGDKIHELTAPQAATLDKLAGQYFAASATWLTPAIARNPTPSDIERIKDALSEARRLAKDQIRMRAALTLTK
jgi:N12 class adenine-specific DNA methylase